MKQRDKGTMTMDDLRIPDKLNPIARRAALAIVESARKLYGDDVDGGGCRAFYTPKEWLDRGEDYGNDAELVVVHDGGSLAPLFNYDYCDYAAIEQVNKALARVGCWAESCTSWYTAIYKL